MCVCVCVPVRARSGRESNRDGEGGSCVKAHGAKRPRRTHLPVLVTIISLVSSLNLIHRSTSSRLSLIFLSDASPFSLPFWNSLSTALRRCSRRWSGLEEAIVPGAGSHFQGGSLRGSLGPTGSPTDSAPTPRRIRHLRAPGDLMGARGGACARSSRLLDRDLPTPALTHPRRPQLKTELYYLVFILQFQVTLNASSKQRLRAHFSSICASGQKKGSRSVL